MAVNEGTNTRIPSELATVTHARLRAVQGDAQGARRILREILSSHPDCEPAQTLLREISTAGPDARAGVEPDERDPSSTSPATVRLTRWLERIRRRGRSEPAR